MAPESPAITPERVATVGFGLGGLAGYLLGLSAGAVWVIHRLREAGRVTGEDMAPVYALVCGAVWLGGMLGLRTREVSVGLQRAGVGASRVALGGLLGALAALGVMASIALVLGDPGGRRYALVAPMALEPLGVWLAVYRERTRTGGRRSRDGGLGEHPAGGGPPL